MARAGSLVGWVVVVLAGVSLAGCAEKQLRLPAFLQDPRRPVSATDYHVLPPDVLLITSIKVQDINNVKQQVRPDGCINLPLLGEVYVADKTPKEIEDILCEKAKEFYEQTDARVEVTDYRSQKIYVFGQVLRPGPVPYTGADTLVDVLDQVQPNTLAWQEQIRVTRARQPRRGGYLPEKVAAARAKREAKDGPPPAEGPEADAKAAEREAFEGPPDDADVIVVDLTKMTEKGILACNVYLKPDDIVYVPPTPLAMVGLAIQQLLLGLQPATQTVQLPASAIYSVKSVQNIGGSKSVP